MFVVVIVVVYLKKEQKMEKILVKKIYRVFEKQYYKNVLC